MRSRHGSLESSFFLNKDRYSFDARLRVDVDRSGARAQPHVVAVSLNRHFPALVCPQHASISAYLDAVWLIVPLSAQPKLTSFQPLGPEAE